MTLSKTLQLLLLITLFIAIGCKEEKPKTVLQEEVSEAVPHYICKNNCENSGSSAAGICQNCNEPLLHNDAFHAKDFLKNGPLNVPEFNGGQTTTNNSQTPAPAQNSAGVYHYTCDNGCSGGSGTAGKCKTCGNDLAHNQAYHN
jgi:hypothetical protein